MLSLLTWIILSTPGSLKSSEDWCLKVGELYESMEIHSVTASKGDTSKLGVFGGNVEKTIYEFLEDFEICLMGWGTNVQKASLLYNHHLSNDIKAKLVGDGDNLDVIYKHLTDHQ